MNRYSITMINHALKRAAEWPQASSDDFEEVRHFGDVLVDQGEDDSYVITDDENDGKPVDLDSKSSEAVNTNGGMK